MSQKPHDPLAIVAGATGVAGRSMVDHLVHQGWKVLAISRRIEADPRPNVEAIAVDIGDSDALAQALSGHRVTHLFYCVQYRDQLARSSQVTQIKKMRSQLELVSKLLPVMRFIPGATHALYRKVAKEAGSADPNRRNLHFFRTLTSVLEHDPHALMHVSLLTGGKHYGMHLGPALYPQYSSHFVEDETPRAPGPNWYYDVEDYIESHQPTWTWTTFRPSFIIGYARNAPYNFGTTVAVYASLRKARGEPLTFFGDTEAGQIQWDVSSADQMAEMMLQAADQPKAHRQAFNCTAGQSFSWNELWPKLAEWFGMEAHFEPDGFAVRPFFEENADLWSELTTQHHLEPHSLAALSSDDFVDRAMAMNWDATYSMTKARQAEIWTPREPSEVFTQLFNQLVRHRIIPAPQR